MTDHRYVIAPDMEPMKAYFFDGANELYLRIIWLDHGVVVFPGEEMSVRDSLACVKDQIDQQWSLEVTDFCDVPLLRAPAGKILFPKNPDEFWRRFNNAIRREERDDRVPRQG